MDCDGEVGRQRYHAIQQRSALIVEITGELSAY